MTESKPLKANGVNGAVTWKWIVGVLVVALFSLLSFTVSVTTSSVMDGVKQNKSDISENRGRLIEDGKIMAEIRSDVRSIRESVTRLNTVMSKAILELESGAK